jgi:ribosomal protein S18 acetylase RimI-like enzyme
VTWRPLEPADAPALHALVAEIEEADAQSFRTSLAEIEEEFENPWRDPATDTIGAWDASGRLRAFGSVDTRPGDARVARAFVHGGVHPELRGQGVGRELVTWMSARARHVLAEKRGELPARIVTYLEETGPAAERRLFETAGFVTRRYYATLRRDLAAPVPSVHLGAGLRLEPWAPELDEATRLAHNDAFRDHWGSEPQAPELWAHARSLFAPSWSFVVVDTAPDATVLAADPDIDAETRAHVASGAPLVVGYHLAKRYEQDWAVNGYTSGYSDALGVRRSYRGRRVAVALLAAAMEAFAADGMQYAVLDVDTDNPTGAHGLYASLGYEQTAGSRMLTIDL